MFKKHRKLNNKHVELAVGKENGKWYLQTTDILTDTYLSESILENSTKDKVIKLAKKLSEKYKMNIQNWTDEELY